MILIGLGANLPSAAGNPAETLRAALHELSGLEIVPRSISHFFVTPAWPDPAEPPFVNAVARVETKFSPQALLQRLHDVEGVFGRRRDRRNAPRTLDLDLL